MQQVADWDAQWRIEPSDPRAPDAEERTPRWRAQERLVRERFGGFDGLAVVELGAGRGLNALLYAPQAGDETRDLLRQKAGEAKDKASGLASNVKATVVESAGTVRSKASDVAGTVTSKVSDVAGTVRGERLADALRELFGLE